MSNNKLTDGQLLFRLQDFYGAEQDATQMGDYEFAQECADIVSVIRELQERRKAANPDYYVVVTSAGVWQTFCKNRAEAEFIISKPFNPGYSILEIYTTPPTSNDKQVGELTMWIKRLAHSLKNSKQNSKLSADAMAYLSKNGLVSVEDALR